MSRAYDAETAHLREMERWAQFNTLRGFLLSVFVSGLFVGIGLQNQKQDDRGQFIACPVPSYVYLGELWSSKEVRGIRPRKAPTIKAEFAIPIPVRDEPNVDSNQLVNPFPTVIGESVDGDSTEGVGGTPGPSVGDGTSGGAFNPAPEVLPIAMFEAKPQYPEFAQRIGTEGKVVVEVLVGVDGTVEEALVVRSENSLLDGASIRAAKHWKFQPGRMNGKPVPVKIQIPFVFRLAH